MPKCKKCGNTRHFRGDITINTWGHIFYDKNGEVDDYNDKGGGEVNFDNLECGECDSEEIDY